MEDAGSSSGGEVSPGLLKRSAPDELSEGGGGGGALYGQQQGEDERDVKRLRVDSEVGFHRLALAGALDDVLTVRLLS